MSNDEKMTKPEARKPPPCGVSLIAGRSFGFRHSGFLRISSFVIHPRGDAKRIKPPFGAHHAANGQGHPHASVPRRQVTAFSGFADRLPLAPIRTHGELETIAA